MPKKIVFLLLLALPFACWQLLSQPVPVSEAAVKKLYDRAEELYNLSDPSPADDSLALSIYESITRSTEETPARASLIADCHIKAGTYHQYYQHLPEAIAHYRKALAMNTKHLNDPGITYMSNLYLGTAFYAANVIDSASLFLEKAAAFADVKTGLPEQETLYNSLGVIYYESADFSQAKNYFSRALSVTTASAPDEYNEAYASFTNNIANCLTQLGKYDEALQQYRLLLQRGLMKEKVMQNMGHTFFEMKQYDSALHYFSKVPLEQNIAAIKMLNEKGRIYVEQRNWAAAEQVFDSALAMNSRVTGVVKNRNRAKSYLYRSLLAEKQGLYDEAITWINQALRELHFTFSSKGIGDLPPDVINVVSPVGFMEALQHKAGLFFAKYRITGNRQQLETALRTYLLAIDAGNYIKRNFDNDEAKLFFNNTYSPLYEEAAEAAWHLYERNPDKQYADIFLRITENYKGSILYQNMEQVKLKEQPDVPPDLLERERNLKKLLAFYTTRLNENTNEADEAKLQQRFNELQVQLSRVQQSFENLPRYQLYKYQTAFQQHTIASVQRQLDRSTAVISYVATDSMLYCLAINHTNYQLTRLVVNPGKRDIVQQFIRATYNQTEGKRYEGYTAGAQLYQLLFAPLQTVTAGMNRWVIMPDGWTNYIPFEALVTDGAEKKMVLQDKIVSYHYSFSLLLRPQQAPARNNDTIAAFAPFVQTAFNDSLPALPFSLREIQQKSGKQYIAAEATKQRFLQQSGAAGILHLATHARAGSDTSGGCIYFFPQQSDSTGNRLYLHEVYNLPLQSCRLVILSACETAGGEQTNGEGLLSLSRAFLYAGSNGIVSTLWRTEDQVSAYLMQRMHHYLSAGHPAETALTNAKRDFLNEPGFDPRFKAPNYWSNFIYVGNIMPQPARPFGHPLAIVLYAIIAALLVRWFIKRKRS
jgi:CHAT domain-containing protein